MMFACMATTVYADDIDFFDKEGDGGNDTGGGAVKPRSLRLALFTAELTEDMNIDFTFTQNIGSTEIVIKDENGVVYCTRTINTSQTNNLTIDVSGLIPGSYTITVKNSAGSINKYGKFVIH